MSFDDLNCIMNFAWLHLVIWEVTRASMSAILSLSTSWKQTHEVFYGTSEENPYRLLYVKQNALGIRRQ